MTTSTHPEQQWHWINECDVPETTSPADSERARCPVCWHEMETDEGVLCDHCEETVGPGSFAVVNGPVGVFVYHLACYDEVYWAAQGVGHGHKAGQEVADKMELAALMEEGYREMAGDSEPELRTSTVNPSGDVVTVRDGNPLHANMRATFDACLAISVAKNADYAGDEDPLANFRECEKDGVPLIKGILVRIGDKRARMRRLLNGHEAQVADEKLTDTIRDKINYLAIVLYALETE